MFPGERVCCGSGGVPFHSVLFSTIGFADLLDGLLLFLMRAGVLVQESFTFSSLYLSIKEHTIKDAVNTHLLNAA